MTTQTRIDVTQAHQKSNRGQALLVCAYEDEEKCKNLRLKNALTLQEFNRRRGQLPRDLEIVFYCN